MAMKWNACAGLAISALAGAAMAQQPGMKVPPSTPSATDAIMDKSAAQASQKQLRFAPLPVPDKLKSLMKQGVQSTSTDLGASGVVSPNTPKVKMGDVMAMLDGTNVNWTVGIAWEYEVRFHGKSSGESNAQLRLWSLQGRRALIDCGFEGYLETKVKAGATAEYSYDGKVQKVPVENFRASFVLPLKSTGTVVIRPSYGANGVPDLVLKACEVTLLKN
ncbi:MAG TPA: hypothetical protein PLQ11_10765 [Beijerinckiaceae bacterium]|nr:hypothetical protein [Beijerinckiaceae bacterium]